MVDYVLSLLRDGHRGPIVAMSRRGLLAKPHRHVELMRLMFLSALASTTCYAGFAIV